MLGDFLLLWIETFGSNPLKNEISNNYGFASTQIELKIWFFKNKL
jgi:hypothetical protein